MVLPGVARSVGGLLLVQLCVAALPPLAGQVEVRVDIDPPKVEKRKPYDWLAVPGAVYWGAPGAPVLPWIQVTKRLDPGVVVDKVEVRLGEYEAVHRPVLLAAGVEEHSPIDGPSPARTGTRRAAPARGGEEPRRPWTDPIVGHRRGCPVVTLAICPVKYDASTRTACFTRRAVIEIHTRAAKATSVSGGGTRAKHAPRGEPIVPEARGGDDETVAYAVVTSPAFAQYFQPLVDARSAAGTPGAVFTTDWIFSTYDGTRPDGGVDDATKLRNFVTDYYQNHGLRYLLLGGDADATSDCEECEDVVVPARYLQSRALFTTSIPADMYFGCLDGTFDGDGDGVYGEPNDGPGGGEVDFFFEVHVGRAPIDTIVEAENFVRKTLAYESSGGAVLRDVLLVGEYLGFGGDYDYGGNLNDQIRTGSEEFISTVGFENSVHADFFRISTLYDRDVSWTPESLSGLLEEGVHIVNHVGHADNSQVMKLTNGEIDDLASESYFFGYTQSCYSGAFDNRRPDGSPGTDSVVEHLVSGAGGAVAFVAGSRRGWASTGVADGPSQRFNRVFWSAVLDDGVLQPAAANDRAKEESLAYVQLNERARWCAYHLNTFGDPLLTLRLAGPKGTVTVARNRYNPGDELSVTVIDSGGNSSPEAVDTLAVTVSALGGGDTEELALSETGPSSSVFQGRIALAKGVPSADGTLQVSPPDTASVIYQDEDDGSGTAVEEEARVAVVDPVTFDSGCPPSGYFGVPYEATVHAAGGVPPYRFLVLDGYREELRDPYFQGIGYATGWDADDASWSLSLPFAFPFYGKRYEVVQVSSNGYLELGSGNARDFAPSVEKLIRNTRIAPLWADLVTSGVGNIYVREQPESVAIRWSGENYQDGENANAEVELFADGRIRFGYGMGNMNLSPTIGISAGDTVNYVVSELSGSKNLSRGPAAHYLPTRLPDGLTLDPQSGRLAGVPGEVGSNEIALKVADALGQTVTRFCRLDIHPDGLVVLAPREGDPPWIAGSDRNIEWEWFGEVGDTLRIDYNTTGSETEFPFTIVAAVPVSSREYVWHLPPTVAQRARIRIQSIELPQLFAVSDEFSIAGATILLDTPNGGEVWVTGTEALIEWRSFGNTGTDVRIDYNTDGSLDTFPLLLAGSTPNYGSLRVPVPATLSESCRLRVQSLSAPESVAVSDAPFAIRGPSLTVKEPNGGECLRGGSRAIVTWLRQGNTGSDVVIEYNTDGSADSFPLSVSEGPVPNTGSFEWDVPRLSASSRLRVRSTTFPSISDVSDGAFTIGSRCEIRALLWVPFVSTGAEQVVGLLSAVRTFEPDLEPTFSTATTPVALRDELASVDALIIPRQKWDFGPDFDALGRSLGPVLREFAARGGAVVVAQQTSRSEVFLRATGLLDFERDAVGTTLCEVAAPSHALAAAVRPNFPGPISTSWFDVKGPDVDHVVTVSNGSTVVAARDLGFGRLSFLGFDYYSYNSDTARIAANAVRVTLPQHGLRLTSPAPGATFLAGQQVSLGWFALGDAFGRVALRYNTTGSTTEFPSEIAESDTAADGTGLYLWSAPEPAPEDTVLEVTVLVHSLADPTYEDFLSEPFYVIRPLTIDTSEIPEGNVGLPFDALLSASGGVPPYVFSVEGLTPGLVVAAVDDTTARIHGIPQEPCENCELAIEVEDSVGGAVQKFIGYSVVERQIQILQPNGGELLLFGGDYEIRWLRKGLVGETVTIRYNLTGGVNEFPELIAASVPNDGSHVWRVPALTAPRCRMRIQSDEFPQIAATGEGSFSIVGPTIQLTAPNGGECWSPQRTKTIAWKSVGNDAGTVRIELSTSGDPGDFSHVVTSGAPNTGEYVWNVPDLTSDSCRVRILFENAPEISDISDDPFSLDPDCGVRVVVWSPCPGGGVGEENIVEALEQNFGDIEISRTSTWSYELMEPLLFNQDALIVPLAKICQTLDYETLGGHFEETLQDYVRSGGVVAFVSPNSLSSRLLAGLGVAERVRIVTSQAGLPCRVVDYLHPIVRGVPLEFDGPFSTTSYSLVASPLATVVEADGNAVVAASDEGAGRWVLCGFNHQVREAVSERLLVDSILMEPVRDGLRVLYPRPGQVFAAGDPVGIEWASRGELTGAVELRYNRTGSTDDFPLLIGTADSSASGGTYPWTAPDPPPGQHLRARLQVRWVAEPGTHAVSEGPFYVTESPLLVETTELPVARLGAEYVAPIEVSGGVPPYEFDPGELPSGLYLSAPSGSEGVATILGLPVETVTDFRFSLSVEDALGSEAQVEYIMKVLPSRLILLSPKGGEILLEGSTFSVSWEVRGYVGETVRVEYNTTGSEEEFGLVAAEAAPADSPFVWTVPETVSDRCRMRIRSNQLSHESVSAGTFAIAAPGIRCLFPNGYEALDATSERTIRWRSLGNSSGRVRVDLVLGDGPGADTRVISDDVPDTGEYRWLVPELRREDCRVCVTSLGDPELLDTSDASFSIRFYNRVRGLIWTPYASHDQLEVRGAIAAITTIEHDFDWQLSLSTSPDRLRSELSGRETFVVVQQQRTSNISFSVRGRELGPVLEEFVRNGGTVVVLKQLGLVRDFLPATGLLAAVEIGSADDPRCQVVDPDHPVVDQVPDEFSPLTATAWYDVADDDAEVYVTAGGHPVAAGRDIGDGRVVLIGFDYRNYSVASATLLGNAVRMRHHEDRTSFVRGDADASGELDIGDPITILNYLYVGGAEPPCLDAADVDDSARLGDAGDALDLSDPIWLLRWLYVGDYPLPPPPAPSGLVVLPEDCGVERTSRDGLGCERYVPCE